MAQPIISQPDDVVHAMLNTTFQVIIDNEKSRPKPIDQFEEITMYFEQGSEWESMAKDLQNCGEIKFFQAETNLNTESIVVNLKISKKGLETLLNVKGYSFHVGPTKTFKIS